MKKAGLITTILFIASFSMAQTTAEMFKESRIELDRSQQTLNDIDSIIYVIYKDDSLFLEAFEVAQLRWKAYTVAELRMKYPHNEPGFYGSLHPMCLNMYQKELIDARIERLQRWIKEPDEKSACRGSSK